MAYTAYASLGVYLGHLFIICLFATGAQTRRFAYHRNNEKVSSRQGGYPKFPIALEREKTSCGLKVSPKIIGGSSSFYGEHPWQVELEYYERRKGFVHHCGGALIGPFHVLTAAHCLFGRDKHSFRLKAGDHNLERKDEDEQMFSVESWKIHPNFREGGEYYNDIAVVKIAGQKGIQMSRFVSPVCLPSASTPYIDGAKCQVSGWGITNPLNEFSHSKVLQSVEVPLMSKEVCQQLLGNRFGSGMVCAGYLTGEKDACNGDSGGPLVCEVNGLHFVLGIVSWGIGCGDAKQPGVYSNTQYFSDWILQALEDL